MNTNEKCDKSQMSQKSDDARREEKIESLKPGHGDHKDDGSCGCDMSDLKKDKEGERES